MNRTRLLALGVVVVAFLFGGVAGMALERYALAPPAAGPFQAGPGGAGGDGPVRRMPARMRHRFVSHLDRELDLTPEQRARVDSLFAAQQQRTRELTRRMRPQFDSLMQRTHEGLRQILTPEQWTKFERMRGQRMRRER